MNLFLSFSFIICVLASGSSSFNNFHQPFPIVEPDPGHTKLHLAREGLEALERITTPIATVAVIGPYRSGKSFLLNQLLSLSCNEGFGVGHMRDTKTKSTFHFPFLSGIWLWGSPIELDITGGKTSVFYLDTEGFESVGKSNVYDDRIFSLAMVMATVLIYNLPETIREADISRLSLAVELAEEFYGRVKGQDIAFEPAKLLWLIQQGKAVQEMVNEALQRVSNSDGDENIDKVNQIRDSLAVMGNNNTAFSLPHPHLQHTKLCEIKGAELDPEYVKKREKLAVNFSTEGILDALNQGEILSTGSLVEVFNKGIVERRLKLYREQMANMVLPMQGESLQKLMKSREMLQMEVFEEQHFGHPHARKSVDQLEEEIEKDKMDELQALKLPSMEKFNAECVGPSKSNYEQRMMKMLGKSKSLFIKDYNKRLFNWLVVFSLVMVIDAWILFIFLETYKRMFWSAESLYYNPVSHSFLATWETLVWAIPICLIAAIFMVYWRCCGRMKHGPLCSLPVYNNHKDQSD
ncbi:unnamed protein product [Withania somnifera]